MRRVKAYYTEVHNTEFTAKASIICLQIKLFIIKCVKNSANLS